MLPRCYLHFPYYPVGVAFGPQTSNQKYESQHKDNDRVSILDPLAQKVEPDICPIDVSNNHQGSNALKGDADHFGQTHTLLNATVENRCSKSTVPANTVNGTRETLKFHPVI